MCGGCAVVGEGVLGDDGGAGGRGRGVMVGGVRESGGEVVGGGGRGVREVA